MKMGIVVHSQTGHTLLIAEKIRDALKEKKADVTLHHLSVERDKKTPTDIVFDDLPDISGYDTLVFGSSVEAFTLSPVMKKYLAIDLPMQNKRVHLFVTQHLPSPMLGGNRAIRRMKSDCNKKGAAIGETAVINWSGKARDRQIAACVQKLSNACVEK